MEESLKLPMYRSSSQFSTYETCPLRYKYQYVDQLPEEQTIPLEIGSAVHKILEESIKDKEYDMNELLSNAFDNLDLSVFDDESQEMSAATNIRTMLESFLRWWSKSKYKVVATEIEFEIPCDTPIKGVIDLVLENQDGELEIIDYKTGKSKETKNTIHMNRQLAIYCQGVKVLYGKYPVKAHLFYLKNDKLITADVDKIPFHIHDEKMTKLNKYIKGGVFPPKPGYICNWCSYYNTCEAYNK